MVNNHYYFTLIDLQNIFKLLGINNDPSLAHL